MPALAHPCAAEGLFVRTLFVLASSTEVVEELAFGTRQIKEEVSQRTLHRAAKAE